MTDWQAWHTRYEDAGSSLSRRLGVVQRRLEELLRGQAPVRRVLSLCSGDARDIVPVLAGRPSGQRPMVTLVEIDPALSAAAQRRAADAGVVVNAVVGDAGVPRTWRAVTPVDLLMLCGIFGNICEADIRATIDAARAVLTREGSVIWTRGHSGREDAGDDLRPRIRQWFAEAGFTEIAFDFEAAGYGVGVNRLAVGAPATPIPDRLFSFVR